MSREAFFLVFSYIQQKGRDNQSVMTTHIQQKNVLTAYWHKKLRAIHLAKE